MSGFPCLCINRSVNSSRSVDKQHSVCRFTVSRGRSLRPGTRTVLLGCDVAGESPSSPLGYDTFRCKRVIWLIYLFVYLFSLRVFMILRFKVGHFITWENHCTYGLFYYLSSLLSLSLSVIIYLSIPLLLPSLPSRHACRKYLPLN